MNRQTDQLLMEIQQAALCNYLSDITRTPFDERAKELISQISEDRYELEAWNEAASYILGEKCSYQSVSETKDSILKHG